MVKIIAEIGINHSGSIDECKKMMMLSKVAGCEYVKIQKRNPDICVPEHQKSVMRKTPWGEMTYLEYKHRYKIGEQTYYYPIDNINTSLKYLINKNIITKDGNFNIVSGHDPKKTEIYLSSLKNKYPNIKIERF